MTNEPKDRNRIRSLEKGLELLIILSRQDTEIGLEDLSCKAGFAKTSCFRLLQTMKQKNFVRQSPRTKGYQFGSRNIVIGAAALDRQSVRKIALLYMKRIRMQTDETVNLTILERMWP